MVHSFTYENICSVLLLVIIVKLERFLLFSCSHCYCYIKIRIRTSSVFFLQVSTMGFCKKLLHPGSRLNFVDFNQLFCVFLVTCSYYFFLFLFCGESLSLSCHSAVNRQLRFKAKRHFPAAIIRKSKLNVLKLKKNATWYHGISSTIQVNLTCWRFLSFCNVSFYSKTGSIIFQIL